MTTLVTGLLAAFVFLVVGLWIAGIVWARRHGQRLARRAADAAARRVASFDATERHGRERLARAWAEAYPDEPPLFTDEYRR